jgi:hypothetical protein
VYLLFTGFLPSVLARAFGRWSALESLNPFQNLLLDLFTVGCDPLGFYSFNILLQSVTCPLLAHVSEGEHDMRLSFWD